METKKSLFDKFKDKLNGKGNREVNPNDLTYNFKVGQTCYIKQKGQQINGQVIKLGRLSYGGQWLAYAYVTFKTHEELNGWYNDHELIYGQSYGIREDLLDKIIIEEE